MSSFRTIPIPVSAIVTTATYRSGCCRLHSGAALPPERTPRALRKLAAFHRRIWLMPGAASVWDTKDAVEKWLTRRATQVDESTLDRLYLQVHCTPLIFLDGMEEVDVELGAQINLVGRQLAPEAGKTMGPESGCL